MNPAGFNIVSRGRRIIRRLGGGRRRMQEDFSETAAKARRQLQETMPELERLFLDIGTCLEPLSTGSQRLVTECETLLRLASGRENGQNLMNDTLAVLEGPLGYIDACLSQRDRLVSLLTTCEEQAGEMIKIRSDMHETLAPLTYLTVLFKIESARLAPDMQETFVTVTTEIERMRQLVDETFAENARLLNDARTTLAGVRGRLESDFKNHAQGLGRKREEIGKAIRTLDEQLSHNNERDLRMHTQSRIIATEVSQIISGLQFQDIIQQKGAHVVGELGAEAFRDGSDPARLQACHVDAICSDLDNGLAHIRSGLASIDRETDRFDEICLKLDGLEGMVASADGMVQLLLDVLTEVGDIIRVVAELTDQASRTLAPMKDLAHQLTSAVVELSIDMRLIALNAQIRSVQGGQGTGLEVLAARTAMISDETTSVTAGNFSKLTILRESIHEMLEKFADFQTRGNAQLTSFHAGRKEIEARLHAMRDHTLEAFATISGTLGDVRDSSKKVAVVLEDVPLCRDHFLKVASLLHELHDRHDLGDEPSSEAAERARTYTMASEHAVHAAVFGTGKPTAGEAVELFDAAVAQSSVSSPKISGSEPGVTKFGEDAELF
jgi:hypothetical protein